MILKQIIPIQACPHPMSLIITLIHEPYNALFVGLETANMYIVLLIFQTGEDKGVKL